MTCNLLSLLLWYCDEVFKYVIYLCVNKKIHNNWNVTVAIVSKWEKETLESLHGNKNQKMETTTVIQQV